MLNSSQIPDSNFIRSKEKGQRSTSMSENTSSLIPRDHPAPLRMYILPAEKSSLFLRRAVPVLSLPVLNYAVFSPLNALSSCGNSTYSLRTSSYAVSSVKHFLITLSELIISIWDTFYLTYIHQHFSNFCT